MAAAYQSTSSHNGIAVEHDHPMLRQAADAAAAPSASRATNLHLSSTLEDAPIRSTRSSKQPSRKKKAIAACTGAVATSLLMTPFDVIKTRMQTQSNAEPLFLPSAHISSPIGGTNAEAGPSNQAARRGGLPRPAVSAHPATCCQQTFFTGNPYEANLTCRFDPRGNPISLVGTTTSASRTRASAAPHPRAATSRGVPYSITATRPRAGGGGVTSAYNTPTPPAASTCAFPNRGVAAEELLSAGKDKRLTGLWDGVIKVGRAEGVRGLWRGLTPTLMMTIPSQVTYMTAYDYFRELFLSLEGPKQSPLPTPPRPGAELPLASPSSPSFDKISAHSVYSTLLAGGLARTLSATLVTPLELARTRLQAAPSLLSISSLVRGLGEEIRTDRRGVLILWRGLAPTLWRDVPFSAVYFAGYEAIKRSLTGGGLGESGSVQGASGEFGVAFVAGATSGSFAALLTQPFDLVKTRLQARGPPTSTQPTAASQLQRLSPSLRAERSPSTLSLLVRVAREEGVQNGLFKGLVPRVAKVAPACGIMIASFEVVGRMLQ